MAVTVLRRWVDTERCTGCRTCEVACSYHHTGSFQPSVASIRVERDEISGVITLAQLSTCDGCPEEKCPWCIVYCSRDVLDMAVLGLVER